MNIRFLKKHMKKIGIYNAGALFSEGEQNQRKLEGSILRREFDDKKFEILNPVDFQFNDFSGKVSFRSSDIFKKDYNSIKSSKYVIFDIDSRDEGTFMEFGFAFEQCLIQEKYLIVVFSDFRIGINRSDKIPGYSRNEMITGSFDYNEITKKRVFKVSNFNEAVQIIKKIENL